MKFERMAFLAQVKEAKMRSFVAPGQALLIEGRLLHDGSGYAVGAGRIVVNGRAVADAEMTYRIMPFPTPALREAMLAAAARVALPAELLV
jgi:3-hydroxyacyl-[acyl-carrier-protein] dehydratase